MNTVLEYKLGIINDDRHQYDDYYKAQFSTIAESGQNNIVSKTGDIKTDISSSTYFGVLSDLLFVRFLDLYQIYRCDCLIKTNQIWK